MGRRAGNGLGLGVCLIVVAAGCGTSTGASHRATDAVAPPAGAATTSAVAPSSRPASPSVAPSPSPITVASASPEAALTELWRVGGPEPSRRGACCVTVAPDGRIWASASYDSTFWILDPKGTYLESWGTAGSQDGEFNLVGPDGGYGAVAFDPDGTFYVADTGNHRVQKFDKEGHLVKPWGSFGTDDGEFATPGWIASDGRGNVYVADADRLDVQQFSSDGVYVRTLAVDTPVEFIATDPAGLLYVDAGPRILVFDHAGRQHPGFDLSATGALAGGMAFGRAGNIYVATVDSYNEPIHPGAIYEIDPAGTVVHSWPGDADSVALDPKGAALYTSLYGEPYLRALALPNP